MRTLCCTLVGLLGLGLVGLTNLPAEDPQEKDVEKTTIKKTTIEKEEEASREAKDDVKEKQTTRKTILKGETFMLEKGKGVRSSVLDGLEVVNNEGESFGSVSDLVVEIESGQIKFVTIASGGFLGVPDKLIAVPWKSFRISHEKGNPDNTLMVLDKSKEEMKAAPSFDQNDWPAANNNHFWMQVNDFYKAGSAEKTAEKPGEATKQ